MPLRRIKVLYCIAAISIAVILDCTGGVVGWTAAVAVLIGALPMFTAVKGAVEGTAFDDATAILQSIRQHRSSDYDGRAQHERDG